MDLATAATVPAGFRGTRGELLVTLKKAQPITAKELAARFGVTANALRRHLKELEVEGLVQYRREIRGVGGPMFAYSLTSAGEALFPRAYESALAEALEHVKALEGADGVVQLFRRRWEALAASARPELALLPVPERARRLAEFLTTLGYMAEAQVGDAAPSLTEHNCAIRHIAERFPEVCEAEEQFIREVLGVVVTRQAHIAKGANSCAWCIESGPPHGTTTAKQPTPLARAAAEQAARKPGENS